ncbi:cleavage stimulation factor subunit 1 [Exaiptasia diaphana]|uniref:Cleavage stimulation factor 50 kDa subunit n=1 Tax=Exaiptasia diaphana TaxID=2652724 RepID=A0A913Y8S6_EXADI|nr:cleavage stimulation factor subunit 1 [Exaiptasia diaphana]
MKMEEAVKERENLYKLIISQLRYDGCEAIAASLAKTTNIISPCPPSARLHQVVNLGLRAEAEGSRPENPQLPGLTSNTKVPAKGIDLEYEPDDHGTTPPAAMYETYYVTAHKAPCRTAAFSASGRLVATGSVDASIKVLDVDRMVAKNTMPQTHDQGQGMNLENHPVIRTLYDHQEEVTAVEFHPSASVLVSGSKDCTIKLFDISKPSVKKAYRAIQEAEVINSMSFHPCGDFILVSTEHPTIRLYDINTFQCFVSANPREFHTAPVTMVKYAPTGNLYASSSVDGSIKVWDGVSNKCVATFPQAHKGAEVYTVQFSHNSKYLISCGKDNIVFLWELSTGRAVNMYTGAAMSNYRTQAVFNHTEDFILVADEKNKSISCWNTRTTEKQKSLISGHNNHIRHLVHSPAGAAFISCSDDFRARFWYCEGV